MEVVVATGRPNWQPMFSCRVRALHEVRQEPEFLSVALSYKRLTNILKDAAEAPNPSTSHSTPSAGED